MASITLISFIQGCPGFLGPGRALVRGEMRVYVDVEASQMPAYETLLV